MKVDPKDAAFEAAWDCARGIDYDELRSLIGIALDAYHKAMPDALHVVFDRMPGPGGSMLIEVETPDGRSVSVGTWVEREDTLAALVLPISARGKLMESERWRQKTKIAWRISTK